MNAIAPRTIGPVTDVAPTGRGREIVRAKLLDAAAELLADAPATEVTAKQIADAAGVNHGQIHHYFGSKDDLVAATIQDDESRYHRERLEDGERFPLPIDTEVRSPAWRTLAYLASSGVWRQPPFDPSPIVETLARRRADDTGGQLTDPNVMADVAATMAMQRGWWILRDIIETALGAFDPDIPAVRREVAERSARLLDDRIAVGEPIQESDIAPIRTPLGEHTPRGREEVRLGLIHAAYELFADRPPTQVTTKEIAARAGVNHGQVHHYFESKEQLVAQTLRFGSTPLLEAMEDGASPVPVPIRTTTRHPMWRTLAHIAATEDWVHEAYGRAPVVLKMVEVVAERTGRPTTSTSVHAQVAAVLAMELGWAIYRDIIEYSLDALDADIPAIRTRIAALSCRLVDDNARSAPAATS